MKTSISTDSAGSDMRPCQLTGAPQAIMWDFRPFTFYTNHWDSQSHMNEFETIYSVFIKETMKLKCFY